MAHLAETSNIFKESSANVEIRTRAFFCARLSTETVLLIDTLDEPNDLNFSQRLCSVM